MGRLIFNSSMGIVGVRGSISERVYFKSGGKQVVNYAGAYSRRDVRGTSNVLCKAPDFSNYTPSSEQIQGRAKFRQASQQVKTIFADPTQLATYQQQYKQRADYGKPDDPYPTLRGWVFSQVYAQL